MPADQSIAPSVTTELEAIAQLSIEFNLLKQPNEAMDLLTLSAQKLVLIQRLETMINEHHLAQFRPKAAVEPGSDAIIQQMFRQFFYKFLLVFGMFQDALGSYLFWNSLFLLIPYIIDPVLIALTVISTALSTVLYYAFQEMFLKEAFDLPSDDTDLGQRIQNDSTQLKTILSLNQVISNVIVMEDTDSTVYSAFLGLLEELNQDMRDKHAGMTAYTETTAQQILKIATVVFGALASIASSYFTVNLLMGIVAASLLSTPIGWSIVILTVVADLGYYYAMGVSSMVNLIHPDLEAHKTFKKDVREFNEMHPDDDDLKRYGSIKQHSFFKEEKPSSPALASDNCIASPENNAVI